jgi:Mg2+ and Co2+ transporter CorA
VIELKQPYARSTYAFLCIAIASLIFGCAKDDVAPVDVEKQAFEDLRAEIRDAIDDPVREAETIRLVGVLEDDLAALRSSITSRKARAKELNANYDTSRSDFASFLAKIEAEVRDNRQQVTKTHQALLANVTPEELSAIVKTHTKAMNAAIKSIQSI